LKAIYDKSGRLIGWAGHNGRLMNRNGGSAFWINQDGNVYDYGGRHAGWWEGDHWRGPDGGIIGWQSGATRLGVTPPLAELPPLAPGCGAGAGAPDATSDVERLRATRVTQPDNLRRDGAGCAVSCAGSTWSTRHLPEHSRTASA
jgi:hypothetical protein